MSKPNHFRYIFGQFSTIVSKISPSWPQVVQDGAKRSQDDPNMAARNATDALFDTGLSLQVSKVAPRWLQDGPRQLQDGPKMAQDSPKMGQDDPRLPQVGLKMAPKRSSKSNPRVRTLWGPFWDHFGISFGPCGDRFWDHFGSNFSGLGF